MFLQNLIFCNIHILFYSGTTFKTDLENTTECQSQWPRNLRLGHAIVHLLGLRVRILPWA
jgi:hypothetical protein